MHLGDCRAHVVNEMQHLRQEETVEGAFWQDTPLRKISNDRGPRGISQDVEYILGGDHSRAKASAIGRISDFQCAPFDIGGMG